MYTHKNLKTALQYEGVDIPTEKSTTRELYGTLRTFETLAEEEVSFVAEQPEKGRTTYRAYTTRRIAHLYDDVCDIAPSSPVRIITRSSLETKLDTALGHANREVKRT